MNVFFTGSFFVRTVPGQNDQQSRVGVALDELRQRHSFEAFGPLSQRKKNQAIAETLRSISYGHLVRLAQDIFDEVASPEVGIAQHGEVSEVAYGNNQAFRKAFAALLLKTGVDVLDTEGDLNTRAAQHRAQTKFYSLAGLSVEAEIGELLKVKNLTVATGESCTAGLISSRLTDVDGSSAYVKRNVVTYCNDAKMADLKVPARTLKRHHEVSEQTAAAMARGALKVAKKYSETGKGVSVVITGFAGGPGTAGLDEARPNGTAFVGLAGLTRKPVVKKIQLDPTLPRKRKKELFSEYALHYLKEYLQGTLT